jgi:hypothetical protein
MLAATRVTSRRVGLLSVLIAIGCAAPPTDEIAVRVISTRPDMVSGGDALVEITGQPDTIGSQDLTMLANGRDVREAFRGGQTPDVLIGRIDGLVPGANTVEVRLAGRRLAALEVTNHPIAGPILSGPHQTPFVCQTEAAGLGAPLDEDCAATTTVTYLYRSTEPPAPAAGGRGGFPGQPGAGFKTYDPSQPRPADVAQTTTSEGNVVDFIVRRERGTINRAIYQIAFLHTPGGPLPDPWSRTPGWNGRLVYGFGGGCSAGYRQGGVGGGLSDADLSAGYAVATSSLNVFGNNCDDVISAETLMMVKEYFIEQFGVPVHTIGTGGSGGSMQQHLIAQNYPGLLDGITPSISYPDIITVTSNVVDCALLAPAFDGGTQVWTDEQKIAVTGFATQTCNSWNRSFSPAWLVPTSCAPVLPGPSVYHPDTNPTGVRCDLYENQVNIFGRDPETGFARRTFDNVGVQYGLVAFNAGTITFDQFVELNQRIGGYDMDGNVVAARTQADPIALRIAYETGRVNAGGGSLGSIPIVDSRPYTDPTGDIHDSFRSFATRARLMAATGRADNHVILRLPPRGGGAGDRADRVDPIRLVDAWLDNVANDESEDPPAVKVARNKPADAVDACWTPTGERIVEPASYTADEGCNGLYPPHADPRIAAGGPLADDVLKCALKPIDPDDYRSALTAGQLSRLEAAFPDGVCDYTRPGVEQRAPARTWNRF